MGFKCIATCDKCSKEFAFADGSDMRLHVLRCDTCGTEKLINTENLGARNSYVLSDKYVVGFDNYSNLQAQVFPDVRSKEYRAGIERFAKKCSCGGRYKFNAPPRCPDCKSIDVYGQGLMITCD